MHAHAIYSSGQYSSCSVLVVRLFSIAATQRTVVVAFAFCLRTHSVARTHVRGIPINAADATFLIKATKAPRVKTRVK